MKTAFVILHYLAENVTSESIDALIRICNGYDVDIIVVDNGSYNGSGRLLAGKYQGLANVHFIFLPGNEGFARGNNVGYKYAKDKLSADCIVIMNNDVIIEDTAFVRKIEQEYKAEPFAVLGPDIFCPATGEHQNPAHLCGFTEKEILDLRKNLSSRLTYFYFKRICWETKILLGLVHAPIQTDKGQNLHTREQTNCVLHGACYIFSKDFIQKRDYAFNPCTFLYFEEDILHYECQRDGLTMRYAPVLQVKHLEDASTKRAIKVRIIREKRKMEMMLQSIDALLTIMHNDSDK